MKSVGICFVEIRSCWRQYRFRVEMQRLRKLNVNIDNIDVELLNPNNTGIVEKGDHCLLDQSAMLDPMLEQHGERAKKNLKKRVQFFFIFGEINCMYSLKYTHKRGQSFTSLKADLGQDTNRGFTFSR